MLSPLHPRPVLSSNPARQLASHHRNRRAEAPPELRALDLLANVDLARRLELIAEAEERVHERHVEAPLRATREVLHHGGALAPVLLPRRLAEADGLCQRANRADGDGWGAGASGEDRGEAVIEVGEEEDVAGREGVHERRLVDAVE